MSKRTSVSANLIATVAAVVLGGACTRGGDESPPIGPVASESAHSAPSASSAPSAAGAGTVIAAPEPPPPPPSPYPPDPFCTSGRPPLAPSYGPVYFREKVDRCQPNDVCGYFLLVASSLTCQDGGESSANHVRKLLREHQFDDGKVIVFIDSNGRRGAGVVFADAERKDAFTGAQGKEPDKMFTDYTVWRAYPSEVARPAAAAPTLLAGPAREPGEEDITLRAFGAGRSSTALAGQHVSAIFDDDEATGWCEGAASDGVGEWVEVAVATGWTVTAVEVTGGWAYNSPRAAAIRNDDGDMWRLSHVVTKMRITWDEGEDVVGFARDTDRGVRKRVPIKGKATKLTFKVEQINRGAGGNNVCLDGIRLVGHK